MKNKQKGFIIPIIIAIIALIAITGSAYIYTNNKQKVSVNVDTSAEVSTKTNTSVNANLPVKANINLSVSGNNLTVTSNAHTSQNLSLSQDAIDALGIVPPNLSKFITNMDVNFDGQNDVGVFTSTGYAGVNNYYDFYIVNKNTGALEKSPVLYEISNPGVDASTKTVFSSYRSGPQWYSVKYKFNGSTYVKSSEAK